MQQAELDR
jgi:hypothetical protein